MFKPAQKVEVSSLNTPSGTFGRHILISEALFFSALLCCDPAYLLF